MEAPAWSYRFYLQNRQDICKIECRKNTDGRMKKWKSMTYPRNPRKMKSAASLCIKRQKHNCLHDVRKNVFIVV